MKRVWITGASGHVGSALSEMLDRMEYHLFLTDLDLDITDLQQVNQFARLNRPDVIINCASIAAADACEADSDQAYRVNALGVRNLAMAANSINAKIIHISTDDVFNQIATTPYNEFDDPHPVTIYGKSKLAGEQLLSRHTNRFVIVRSSWTYGIGKDFVQTVLQAAKQGGTLEVPTNDYASPTSAKELAKYIAAFIDNEEMGIYHVVCSGFCSRYEFAQAILELSGNTDNLNLIPVGIVQGSAPVYSVLDNMMLRLSGMEEPQNWKAALKEFFDQEV